MADWTTKAISQDIEVDLHPDLDSFPMVIRDKNTVKLNGIDCMLLSKKEAYDLMLALIEHFGGVYSTE